MYTGTKSHVCGCLCSENKCNESSCNTFKVDNRGILQIGPQRLSLATQVKCIHWTRQRTFQDSQQHTDSTYYD